MLGPQNFKRTRIYPDYTAHGRTRINTRVTAGVLVVRVRCINDSY
eukprot:SAG11_NODE_5384_length_1576_cov_1.643873_3_plen_45_part_00